MKALQCCPRMSIESQSPLPNIPLSHNILTLPYFIDIESWYPDAKSNPPDMLIMMSARSVWSLVIMTNVHFVYSWYDSAWIRTHNLPLNQDVIYCLLEQTFIGMAPPQSEAIYSVHFTQQKRQSAGLCGRSGVLFNQWLIKLILITF